MVCVWEKMENSLSVIWFIKRIFSWLHWTCRSPLMVWRFWYCPPMSSLVTSWHPDSWLRAHQKLRVNKKIIGYKVKFMAMYIHQKLEVNNKNKMEYNVWNIQILGYVFNQKLEVNKHYISYWLWIFYINNVWLPFLSSCFLWSMQKFTASWTDQIFS